MSKYFSFFLRNSFIKKRLTKYGFQLASCFKGDQIGCWMLVKTEMEKYLIGMRIYLKSHFDSQDLRLIDVIFYWIATLDEKKDRHMISWSVYCLFFSQKTQLGIPRTDFKIAQTLKTVVISGSEISVFCNFSHLHNWEPSLTYEKINS